MDGWDGGGGWKCGRDGIGVEMKRERRKRELREREGAPGRAGIGSLGTKTKVSQREWNGRKGAPQRANSGLARPDLFCSGQGRAGPVAAAVGAVRGGADLGNGTRESARAGGERALKWPRRERRQRPTIVLLGICVSALSLTPSRTLHFARLFRVSGPACARSGDDTRLGGLGIAFPGPPGPDGTRQAATVLPPD
jgi:hypothetical protein